MKKEYLILILVIVGLSAYLFFHKENRDNYTLPVIEKIDTAGVTAIEIEKGSQAVRFDKAGKDWTVTEDHFPADASMVETLLDTIKTFQLTALVSQKSDLNRYELDKENRITVRIFKSDQKVFEFAIGKDAPTFNHTFVMIEKDDRVYHAAGSFRNDYDRDAADFRNKLVLEVKKDAVKSFTVSKGKLSKTLVAEMTKDEDGNSSVSWKPKQEKQGKDKSAYSKNISTFLASISYLKCDTFVPGKSKKEMQKISPEYTLTIETDKNISFGLFKGEKEDKVLGISSMNDYVFALSDFDAKEIMESMDLFLGIEKADKKE